MKFFSANLKDLTQLYTNALQKALSMEQQIAKALPTMIEKATDTQLKQAFESHLQETEQHVGKLERLVSQATGEVNTVTCKVAGSLITEAQDIIKDVTDPSVLDVALISAGQQVEHHEIAVYGTLRTWAGILGNTDDAATLEGILEQEKQADLTLTGLSSRINTTAETEAYATSGAR